MKSLRIGLLVAAFALPVTLASQQASNVTRAHDTPPEFVVKTVTLHHLTSAAAVKLLAPYVQTPGGGVFEVSSGVRAVTIREVAKIYGDMIAVLNQFDREPGTVTLYFQLIAAESTTVRDPAVAGLDSLLRGVLRFSGYRLLSNTVVGAGEAERIEQSLTADGEPLSLVVIVTDLRVEGNDASVHLNVDLRRSPAMITNGRAISPTVLATGVTVPIGQTVVLGAATTGAKRALILTVRPQLAATGKR
jgi:hypothetical protein